MDFGFVVWF